MAKKNDRQKFRLVSTEGTGYFYIVWRNPKVKAEKMSLRKYDPVLRKHVMFKEEKMK